MNIRIIKYNGGNTRSVINALARLGIEPEITDDKEKILSADKLIFPGVGDAGAAMQYLKQRELDTLIPNLKQPFLGICLGMQLMCRYSEEQNTPCLGIFDVEVKRFRSGKVPQIGWNSIDVKEHPLFKGLNDNPYFYFVHSYYAATSEQTVAAADYLIPFSAAIAKKNFYGVQFHPEKSGANGAQLLKNFIEL